MCPHVVQAQITITVCTSNIWTWIHKRQQYRAETALLVDRSDSDRCLAAIGWASCCLLFIILNRLSHVSIIFIPRYYHYILSVAILPFLSLRDSLSPLLWKLSLGVLLRFLHFHHFKERSSISHTCTSTVLGTNTPCQSPHTPVSIHTVTWLRPHTPVSFACANCWPY